MVTVNGGTDSLSDGMGVTWLQPIVAVCERSPVFQYVPIFKKTWASRFFYEFSQFLHIEKPFNSYYDLMWNLTKHIFWVGHNVDYIPGS